MKSIIAAAGLVAVAQAFTPPVQPPTFGSLYTPNKDSPVTTGQTTQVTWDTTSVTAGSTISLVLCNGPSSNCVLQSSAIVENVPASAGSYSWSVPCSLPSGVQDTATGYGMLIIVDGTGQFQYSTQFSVDAGSSCGSSGSSSSSSSTTSSSSSPSVSTPTGPPSGPTSSGWNSWESSASSTLSTSTVPAPVAPSTPAAVTTAVPATPTYSSYSTSAVSVSTTPQAFTGAAAMPTAFVNAAGIFGAAALAALAL